MRLASASALALLNVRVLLVEDDADAREMFILALESRGASVTAASSAREALMALPTLPHVVITDIKLPGEDGYWLLEQLRAREEGAALPVIAVTGRVLEANGRHAPGAHFDAVATKPIDPFTLCDLVARVLDNGPRAATPPDVRAD